MADDGDLDLDERGRFNVLDEQRVLLRCVHQPSGLVRSRSVPAKTVRCEAEDALPWMMLANAMSNETSTFAMVTLMVTLTSWFLPVATHSMTFRL